MAGDGGWLDVCVTWKSRFTLVRRVVEIEIKFFGSEFVDRCAYYLTASSVKLQYLIAIDEFAISLYEDQRLVYFYRYINNSINKKALSVSIKIEYGNPSS